jgi:hypothetical protein
MLSITEIAKNINSQAVDYQIGGLPSLRKRNKGGGKVSSVLFDTSKGSVNEQNGWAHHSGGNKELQFNIGIEKELSRFRFGVAFSLETSRSYPDISVLFPRIERFNEFVRNNPEFFEPFRMWIWQNGRIEKPDTAVRQITKDERVAKTFIFLGQTLPVSAVNIPYVLQTLDKLLPLYIFVETGLLEETETATSHLHANFEFIEGVTLSEVNQSFRQPQDEIGVTHWHKIRRRDQEW